jgi:RNA polymerase sigma-70 factor (ECF subfamily)
MDELADCIGLALLMVLAAVDPAERLAFVLHEVFGLPYDEIAPILDRTPAATEHLVNRARRSIRAAAGQNGLAG